MPKAKRALKNTSLYQRGDGIWIAPFYYTDPQTGEERAKQFSSKKRGEAARKRDEFERQLAQGLAVDADKQTVGQFLDYWLAEVVRPPAVRPKTYRSYEQNVRLYLKPKLGAHKLTALTTPRVQAFVNAQRAAGYAHETVGRMRDVLRNALNHALTCGLVSRNVAEHAKLPPADAPADDAAPALTPDEARRFLDATREHRLHALFSVALALGLRQGEILGLTWDAVDFDVRAVRVRQQVQRVDGEFAFVDTKSRQSRRIVDLPAWLATALRAHRARQIEERLAAGDRWAGRNLVFCTRWGKPLDGPNVTRYAQAALAKAGLPKLTFHQLRHSCASLLIAQGLPAHEVSRLLGHSDVRLTLNTYTHHFAEARRRAADAMDDLFGGARAVAGGAD